MTAAVSALGCHVLVLNKHYMAIRVIGVKRAISLLFKGLAEVIDQDAGYFCNYDFSSWLEVSEFKRQFEPDEHDWLHSVTVSIAVPRIIRLFVYDRLPRKRITLNRRNIFARDGNCCQYCGKKLPTSELSLDHVVPRNMGGEASWENLVCACLKCNVKKGGRTPEQAHMRLINKPVKPSRCPITNISLNDERYISWKQFLDHAYWSVELK